MTRSDNPFEDLPEWKERQRLQELQAAQQRQLHADPAFSQPGPAPDYSQPQYPIEQDPHAYPAQSYNEPQFGTPMPSGYPEDVPGLGDHAAQFDNPPSLQLGDAGAAPAYYGDEHAAEQFPQSLGYGQHPGDAQPVRYDQADPSLAPGGLDLSVSTQPPPAPYEHENLAAPQYDFGQPLEHQDGGVQYSEPQYDQSVELGHPASQLEAYPGAPLAAGAAAAQGQPNTEEFDDDEEYDDEEQRFSWKLAAAVIVTGAVVTGGGVVLYDSLKGGSSGNAPIVRADTGPAKTRPGEPGGRQFANRDSSLLNNLDSAGGAKTSGRLSDDGDPGNRVRTVPIVRIDRNGDMIPTKPPTTVPAPASNFPGININDSLSGGAPLQGAGALPPAVPKETDGGAAAPATQAERTALAARTPVLRNTTAPEVRSESAKPAAQNLPVIKNRGAVNRAMQPSSEPPPVPSRGNIGAGWRMEAPPKRPTSRPTQQARVAAPVRSPSASANTAGPTQVAPVQTASTGKYVAVLATEESRIAALKSFAELQQKHPAALQSSVLDVQRVDLRARGLGIMYRVVVGPAGSRQGANSVCASLKSEGYNGCWVKAN